MKKIFYTAFVILSFSLFTQALDIKSEAESAALTGLNTTTAITGYSGSGYITGFDNANDQAVFTLQIPTTGLYELKIRYISSSGNKGVDVVVNTEASSGTLNQSSSFSTASLGKYYLAAGQTKVTVKNGWGYYDVDYIMFSSSVALPVTKPAKTLVNPKATCAAKGLFSMLVDGYGTNVLSGQHEFSDIDYLKNLTGKYPAVGNFDLIEYSPTRIAHGANPNGTAEKIINWSKTGNSRGVTCLMWHWNAPTDLYDGKGDQSWYFGFYTKGTSFDLTAALANTSSTQYKLLISDMDAIAIQLKKFRDANIPVLWRPLHEASGGWFWWGAKGAASYKKLWQLMYDRYTNYHGLNNLIWIHTSDVESAWYPGDSYVDIVGMDLYQPDGSSLSSYWDGITKIYGSKKLITLSESGSFPVPDKVRAYGTWWSWFTIWSGDFVRKQSATFLKDVYNDKNVLTMDELPDWRNYTCTVTGIEDSKSEKNISVYPNPFENTLKLKAIGKFNFTILDFMGREIQRGTGQESVEIGESLKEGVYLIKIIDEQGTTVSKVTKTN